jgi:hypothetical protein
VNALRPTAWRAFGRPVRPGAFVLTLVTAILGASLLAGVTTLSRLLDGPSGLVIAAAAWFTVGLLTGGWWASNRRALHAGLLFAAWTWACLGTIVIADTDWWSLLGWMSVCWALLAALLWLQDRRRTHAVAE